MSGLEVAATIAAIISAFVAVGSAVNDFRTRRKKKKQNLQLGASKAETQLLTTVDAGPPHINAEYNHGVARIGSAFEQGDSTKLPTYLLKITGIARTSLTSTLLEMNQSLVNVINSLLTAGHVLFTTSDYESWNAVCSRTTNSTIATLAQLYQRKLQYASSSTLHIPQTLSKVDTRQPDGSSYKGQGKDGLSHGYGIWTGSDGEKYEGEWDKGLRCGYGKTTALNGNTFEGNWFRNKRHGYGVFTWASGGQYKGEFANNQFSGYGTLVYPNQNKYVGYWKNNHKCGKGIQTVMISNQVLDGEWKDDRNGEGTITYGDGTKRYDTWWVLGDA